MSHAEVLKGKSKNEILQTVQFKVSEISQNLFQNSLLLIIWQIFQINFKHLFDHIGLFLIILFRKKVRFSFRDFLDASSGVFPLLRFDFRNSPDQPDCKPFLQLGNSCSLPFLLLNFFFIFFFLFGWSLSLGIRIGRHFAWSIFRWPLFWSSTFVSGYSVFLAWTSSFFTFLSFFISLFAFVTLCFVLEAC